MLVVEDDVDTGLFAVQSLRDLGYGTVLANDVEEALAKWAQNLDRFDVVFRM